MDTRRVRGGEGESSPVLITKICPTEGYHVPQRFTEETLGSHTFKFENRTNAGRSRFLQTFASPDETVILRETAEEPATRWFD